jgi:membrane-bound lytic murein transglycosylase D
MRLFVFISVLILPFLSMANYHDDTLKVSRDTVVVNIAPDNPIIAAMDSMLHRTIFEAVTQNSDTACLNLYGFACDENPVYSKEVYAARIEALNKLTPLDLRYNEHVQAFINLYVNRKRELSSKVLGLSEVYFPMIEEMLDKFGIPLEMKYLAIVESALNPQANSRAGAKGLWQFMYATGKMYHLNVTSYEDIRFDPYASTIAACRYLKFLHGLYGDWNLALAAYNSGPGNVNKAIRRAGGVKDYWVVRKFLPQETSSYVPAFIAVNYMMNYHKEHNLYPIRPALMYIETDTLHIKDRLTFEQITAYTGVNTEQLQFLNPVYKRNIIPADAENPRVLRLPNTAIGVFLANQNDIKIHVPFYAEDTLTVEPPKPVLEQHIVRNGEYLGHIANKYKVSVAQIVEWNHLKSTNIQPGQKLVIQKPGITLSSAAAVKQDATSDSSTEKEPPVKASVKEPAGFRYHTVVAGDTLWEIANKYQGVTINQLKELNKEININRLRPGQKIKIEVIG